MPINTTVDLHVHHKQAVLKLELTCTEPGSRDNPKLSAASQRRAMASFARTTRLFVLLQITVFVVSAMVMTSSVCHGARDVGVTIPGLDRNRPACPYGRCSTPGYAYIPGGGIHYGNLHPNHGGGLHPYPHIPAPPPNDGETPRP